MQRVIHSVLTARILLNLRQAVQASEQKASQEDTTLDWEVASRRRPKTRSRDGQQEQQEQERRRSKVGGIIRNYLSTIYSATLDLDPETWTHDEESAMRSETGDGHYIGMVVLNNNSLDQEVTST